MAILWHSLSTVGYSELTAVAAIQNFHAQSFFENFFHSLDSKEDGG